MSDEPEIAKIARWYDDAIEHGTDDLPAAIHYVGRLLAALAEARRELALWADQIAARDESLQRYAKLERRLLREGWDLVDGEWVSPTARGKV